MITVAAVGDIHFDRKSHRRIAEHLLDLKEKADIFVLAGDLTQTGHPDEMKVLVEDLRFSPIPIVAVLGNHDHHSDQVDLITQMLRDIGVYVLERNSVTLDIKGVKLGVAGAKGFGGGFIGACGSDFGEKEMKNFMRHSRDEAREFEKVIKELECDLKIALLHYSPIMETLAGERKEIYPFLGSYYLAEAVDYGQADIVFHGHAHSGIEKGTTPSGIPVRNVAQPVIRHAYNLYSIEKRHDPIKVLNRPQH
jgi:Icc-related predicted phosphoesterase